MKVAGSHPLAFPREAVWEALMDPEVLSRTLPGCERLERAGESEEPTFEGVLEVAIGPVKGAFRGTLEMTDLEPPESYRMKLQGRGPSGFLTGEGSVRLEETEPAATTLHYDLDAQVGGRIAGVGQRLLDSSARVITKQGLEGLERQLAARYPEAAADAGDRGSTAGAGAEPETPAAPARDAAGFQPAEDGLPTDLPVAPPTTAVHAPAPARPAPTRSPAAPAAPPAPGQAEFAGRFARGLWEELVPPRARPWIAIGGVAAATLAVLALVRACGA